MTGVLIISAVFLLLTGSGLAIEKYMHYGPVKRRLIDRINQVAVLVACVMFGTVIVLTGYYLVGSI